MRVNLIPKPMEILDPGIRAEVKGWIEWRLIDRRGQVVRSGQQHNLFLNKGLDFIMSNIQSGSGGMDTLLLYVAVGTGSVAPAVTDTALQSEIARTSADLGAGSSLSLTKLANGQWRISRTRTFDYAQANGNLTEFGASNSSSSAQGVNTRELFRDGSNNPITITKTSNERLAITYNIDVSLAPVVQTQASDINITGLGTKRVTHIWLERTSFTPAGDIAVFLGSGSGFSGTPTNCIRTWTSSISGLMNYPDGTSEGQGLHTSPGWQTYSNGNYYRDLQGERGPEATDVTIYGYETGKSGTAGVSYRVRFGTVAGADEPIAKNKDYRLRLAVRFSIARV